MTSVRFRIISVLFLGFSHVAMADPSCSTRFGVSPAQYLKDLSRLSTSERQLRLNRSRQLVSIWVDRYSLGKDGAPYHEVFFEKQKNGHRLRLQVNSEIGTGRLIEILKEIDGLGIPAEFFDKPESELSVDLLGDQAVLSSIFTYEYLFSLLKGQIITKLFSASDNNVPVTATLAVIGNFQSWDNLSYLEIFGYEAVAPAQVKSLKTGLEGRLVVVAIADPKSSAGIPELQQVWHFLNSQKFRFEAIYEHIQSGQAFAAFPPDQLPSFFLELSEKQVLDYLRLVSLTEAIEGVSEMLADRPKNAGIYRGKIVEIVPGGFRIQDRHGQVFLVSANTKAYDLRKVYIHKGKGL